MSTEHDQFGRFVSGSHWRPHQVFREQEYLVREYVGAGRSASDIALEHHVTEGAILHWLRKHEVTRRTVSQARELKHWRVEGSANGMFGMFEYLNPNYRGGVSPDRQKLYARSIGQKFLAQVLERDGHCCRRCGKSATTARSLHVHHVVAWDASEELRFAVFNGVTLCVSCHRWVHSKANVAREFLS